MIKELRPSPMELHVQEGERIVLTGQVYKKQVRESFQILYLKDNSIENQEQSFKESRALVYNEAKEEIHIGQTVRIAGEAFFFEPAYNPGNFDQKRYYQIQNIHCQVWAKEVFVTNTAVWKWRERITDFRDMWKEMLWLRLGR